MRGDFAARAGISVNTLRAIENQGHIPRLPVQLKIAEAVSELMNTEVTHVDLWPIEGAAA